MSSPLGPALCDGDFNEEVGPQTLADFNEEGGEILGASPLGERKLTINKLVQSHFSIVTYLLY